MAVDSIFYSMEWNMEISNLSSVKTFVENKKLS